MNDEKIIKQALEFYTDEAYNKYMQEHPDADPANHQKKKTPPRSKGRKRKLHNWRTKQRDEQRTLDIQSEIEKDFDGGSEVWMNEHTVETSKGSFILGTPHVDDSSKEYVYKKLIPKVLSKAEEAVNKNKKVVFLAEGESRAYVENGKYKPGKENDEQEAVANALYKKFGKDKVNQDTWDDKNVDILDESGKINEESSMMKKLKKKFKEPGQAEAAMYAFMKGQGDDIEIPEAAKTFFKKRNIDPKNKKKMYQISFPEDSGDEDNEFSVVGKEFNKLRQDNMKKKISDIEKDGNVAIVTPGASHAFEMRQKSRVDYEHMIDEALRRKRPSHRSPPTPRQPIPYPSHS